MIKWKTLVTVLLKGNFWTSISYDSTKSSSTQFPIKCMAYIHSVEQIHLSHQTIPAMQKSDLHSSTYNLSFIVQFHQPKLVRLLASSFYVIKAVKHTFSCPPLLPPSSNSVSDVLQLSGIDGYSCTCLVRLTVVTEHRSCRPAQLGAAADLPSPAWATDPRLPWHAD